LIEREISLFFDNSFLDLFDFFLDIRQRILVLLRAHNC
jgi:hypothetical protein